MSKHESYPGSINPQSHINGQPYYDYEDPNFDAEKIRTHEEMLGATEINPRPMNSTERLSGKDINAALAINALRQSNISDYEAMPRLDNPDQENISKILFKK